LTGVNVIDYGKIAFDRDVPGDLIQRKECTMTNHDRSMCPSMIGRMIGSRSIDPRDGLPSRGEVSSSRVTTRRVSPTTDEIDLSIAALWIDEGRGW